MTAALVSLALAAAIHTDWHFARPEHHRLSLGLSWHWVVAIPVFALVAWYVARAWSDRVGRATLAIVGGAIVVAGILEPAYELLLGGATFEWAFGLERTMILCKYVVTGLVAYAVTLASLLRGKRVLS